MSNKQTVLKGKQKPRFNKEINRLMTEIRSDDVYTTIKRWEALNPNKYGEQLLQEILNKPK